MNQQKALQFNEVGVRVFLNFKGTSTYENVVKYSITSNTYRSFWRIDNSKPGAKKIVDDYLTLNKSNIVCKLKSMSNEKELDDFSHLHCEAIRKLLGQMIRLDAKLDSYNKTRKLVDLFVEHLVALCSELENYKSILVPILFIPLDSQILRDIDLFNLTERKAFGIKNSSSFACVDQKEKYNKLQSFLKSKAIDLKISHRIYLDLAWNNRYLSTGENLLILHNN